MLAKIGSGLQESQIGDGDGEFGIIYAQVSFLLLPVDIPCKHQHVSLNNQATSANIHSVEKTATAFAIYHSIVDQTKF